MSALHIYNNVSYAVCIHNMYSVSIQFVSVGVSPYVHGHSEHQGFSRYVWMGCCSDHRQGLPRHRREYIFIIKSVQACLVNFDCPHEVVGGAESSKFAFIWFQGVEDVQKPLVSNLVFHIGFLYPLCPNFALFWVVGDIDCTF